MTFYERLCALIEGKNLTFRKVERDCGLANASIRRWETQSPRLESVITVANYLQVSIDYLALGLSEKTASNALACDGIPLTQMESDIISMLRLLRPHDRKNAVDIITMFYEQATGEKGSTYSTYTEDEYRQTSRPADGGSESVIA